MSKAKLPIILIILSLFSCSAFTELRKQEIIKGPQFASYDGLKTTIAVMDFENHADEGGDKFGSAIADMLVSLLVRSGRFIVLERQLIQEILGEQALGQSGAVTEETAPEAGQLLGVQTLVFGEILEASQKTGSHGFKDDDDEEEEEEDKRPWSFAFKATVGHVEINFRAVNTTTGEIIVSDHISATEIRPGIGIKTKDFDFEDTFEFDQTILGLANRKALNLIAKKIAGAADEIEWQGRVVQVKDDSLVYFTPALRSGVRIGELFTIWGTTEEFDDETEFIELHEKAKVEVIEFIGDKVAKAIILEGGDVVQGDRVRMFKELDACY